MSDSKVAPAWGLGAFICMGLIILGLLLVYGAQQVKALNRTVAVKGLAEREVPADIAIWPIKFSVADNDLSALYRTIQANSNLISTFLKQNGFADDEISTSVPDINDRMARDYGNADASPFRYTGSAIVTVYSPKVDQIRQAMKQIGRLGEQGLVIAGDDYQAKTEFLYTKLNELKPAMIEEATRNAREVAEKFAQDSDSRLGKIKQARQGQFSINDRDSNTPYIKKVRVVSTIEYYLID